MWAHLFQRQTQDALIGRVEPTFLDAFHGLDLPADHIPNFHELSEHLYSKTQWTVVPVHGLVPDSVFFGMLADRIFPSTCLIRKPSEIDYLQEPDIFHDIFGHVPLLSIPIFADYMQAYGQAGLGILNTPKLKHLARLYWYTVEFGLIQTAQGLRTYGAGIVSSYKETFYCLESDVPNRIILEPTRVMRTNYKIDDVQSTYFVIHDYQHLFDLMTTDLPNLFDQLSDQPDYVPTDLLMTDKLI